MRDTASTKKTSITHFAFYVQILNRTYKIEHCTFFLFISASRTTCTARNNNLKRRNLRCWRLLAFLVIITIIILPLGRLRACYRALSILLTRLWPWWVFTGSRLPLLCKIVIKYINSCYILFTFYILSWNYPRIWDLMRSKTQYHLVLPVQFLTECQIHNDHIYNLTLFQCVMMVLHL